LQIGDFTMMKLETRNRHDWQGFSRILEIISFVDDLEESSPDEVREASESFCELPPDPGKTMSMEEVVFWAGFAAGMEFSHQADDENVDPATAEKMLIFSSLFSHSVKNAIVDLALGQLERQAQEPLRKIR
jgi:hypothetical protein